MKKFIVFSIFFVLVFSLSVSAQSVEELYREQLEASGGAELFELLPEESRQLLERLGITELDPKLLSETDAQTVLLEFWKLLISVAKTPLHSCGIVFAVLLLHAWMSGLSHALAGEEGNSLFSIVSALAACAAILPPIAQCINETAKTTETLSVFMMSFVPVYAAILITGGHAFSAFSFQSIVLYAAQILSFLSNNFIVPLMGISLAMGLIGSITPRIHIGRVGAMIGKTATWILGLGTLLFTGLLSLQNLAGSAADTLGNRLFRFSIASFVPVVGGSLSEAFSTVRGCLGVLRSTVGVFGIAATAAVVLPCLLRCLVWNGCASFCLLCAEMFELNPLVSLLKSTQTVIKCLIGVLCAGALFAIIAVTVVTLSVSGN